MKKSALSLFTAPLFALPLLAGAAPVPVFKVQQSIAIGGEARWDYLYADSAQHRLYVSHGTQTEVIDTQTNALIGTIADTAGVHGIAIAADLGKGYTSNGKADSVTVFDLATLKPLATIKVGANPDAIVYVAKSKRIVTFNGHSKDASIIDAVSGAVVGTVAIGNKPEFAQVDSAGKVYFNIEDSAELAQLDPVAMKLTQRVSLKPCDSPTGMAMDARQRLYSVCDNKMMVISAPDGKAVGQASIGSGPDGVAWMDGYAFSANGADGNVSMVSETTPGKFKTVATIVTAAGARTITADPATHKLYLPTSDLQARKNGEDSERRKGIPGTFRVLVLSAN